MNRAQKRIEQKNKKDAQRARGEEKQPRGGRADSSYKQADLELEDLNEIRASSTPDEREDELAEFDARPNDQIEKDYYGSDMAVATNYMPAPGPVSWDELDAQEIAEEQAEAVNEATWDVRSLVSNILWHPELNADQKSEAITEVGKGFAPRVNDILSNAESMQKGTDVLLIESILAHDARNTGVVEKVTDIIKRKLSSAARGNLSASEFALPDKKKYPIHDKAHVRNALARAAQQIQGGGSGAEDAKAALPKIRAAAKKFGIEVSTKSQHNAILIEKDIAGDWRWVGWVSNNYIDWDVDIISESAHKEYVEWLGKNMDMAPALLAWHTPGTAAENPVDYAAYENGFLIMSGKLTEPEAQGLLKMGSETDLGMSHNSFVFERDKKDTRIVLKYRTVEATHLPLDKAANPFTDFETLTKEVGMNLVEYLTEIYGSKEKAQAFADRTGLAKKALDEAGLKSASAEQTLDEAAASSAPPKEGGSAQRGNVPNMEAIIKAVEEHLGMQDLAKVFAQMQESVERVPVLEAVIKDLQTNQDERLAEKLAPPVGKYPWMQKARASASADTVLKEGEEDQKLKKSAPSANWMADALGVTPVTVGEEVR